MTHEKLIDGVLAQKGHQLSPAEREAVTDALMAGEKFGFGNMISWLSTAWAVRLRESGMPEETAKAGAWGHSYSLPPK